MNKLNLLNLNEKQVIYWKKEAKTAGKKIE
jgi:hypothetical protein